MVGDLQVDLVIELEKICMEQGYTLVQQNKLSVFSICLDRKNRKVYISNIISTHEIMLFINTYL